MQQKSLSRPILVVNHNDSFVYNLIQIVNEVTKRPIEVVNEADLDPSVADRYDWIILSPGPGMPHDYPNSMRLVEQNGLNDIPTPILGVCMGHQQIGVAFGMQLVQLPHPTHGMQSLIEWQQQHEHYSMKTAQKVGHYHSWIVQPTAHSSSIVVDALDHEHQTVMAIHHTTLPYTGYQFHPESILTPEGRLLIEQEWQYVAKLE